MNAAFQYGTWIPTLQIGNGIIQGSYTDQTGHWTRTGHQIFINGFFKLNYNETQVEEALRRNTTVQEIRVGTLPYEANSGACIFNLMVSNNHFIQNIRPSEEGIVYVGVRSIWGSPRMRICANERAVTDNLNNLNHVPIATDLSIQDLKPSTHGSFIEVRVSGTYTAFLDLSRTDPVNTPLPMITQPASPTLTTYTVQSGDTLWLLSQKFDTTVDQLMALNDLTSTVLHIGQVLLIPPLA